MYFINLKFFLSYKNTLFRPQEILARQAEVRNRAAQITNNAALLNIIDSLMNGSEVPDHLIQALNVQQN